MPSKKKNTIHTENHIMPHRKTQLNTNPSIQLHDLLRQVEHLKNEMNQENTAQQVVKFKEFNRDLEKQYDHAFLQFNAQKKKFKDSIDDMMVQHKLFVDKQHELQRLDAIMLRIQFASRSE